MYTLNSNCALQISEPPCDVQMRSNCALQISEPPCDVQMQEVVYFQEKKMQEVTEFARRISVACVTQKGQ